MKSLLSIAVAVAVMGGSLAVSAATTKKKLTSTPKKRPVTLKVKAKEITAPSRISGNVLLTNEMKVADADSGTSYLELRLNYKIDPDTSFRFAQEFTQSFENGERVQAAVSDTYIQLAKSNLFGTKLNGYVRTLFPTSIASREDQNQKLQLRGELSGTFANLGALSLSAHSQARYYMADELQDETTKLNEDTNIAEPFQKVNREWKLRQYVMGILPMGNFTLLQQAGVEHNIDYRGEGGIAKLYLYSELGMQVTNSFDIAVAAYSLKPMNVASAALYAADQNAYYYINGGLSF